MKIIYLAIVSSLVFVFLHCGRTQTNMIDSTPIITGKIVKNMLDNPTFPWFEKNYSGYVFKEDIVNDIKQRKRDVSVIVFMGTWCDDSKREVPHFFKIMEKAEYSNFEIFGLDKKKKSPEGIESKYNIERIPTFIFQKDGKELGRIVEMPEKTLEEDIEKILTNQNK